MTSVPLPLLLSPPVPESWPESVIVWPLVSKVMAAVPVPLRVAGSVTVKSPVAARRIAPAGSAIPLPAMSGAEP